MRVATNVKDAVYLLVHLAVLLGGALILQVDTLPYHIAIGSALVSGAVTGFALFLYVRIFHQETDTLNSMREFNVVRVFATRSVTIKKEYEERLQRVNRSPHSRHHIDIMGFGLRHLREDHSGDFSSWARKAKVRILVIDPEHPDGSPPHANQRDVEEGTSPGTIAGEVRALVKECRQLGLLGPDSNFNIRLYRCLPSVNIFRIDNAVFWGPYFVGGASRNMPTVLVGQGPLSDTLLDHFEAIWHNESYSRAVPAKWLRTRTGL